MIMQSWRAFHFQSKDRALTLDEAVTQTSGNKLQGPETKPCRGPGSVDVGDLPLRMIEQA